MKHLDVVHRATLSQAWTPVGLTFGG
jgi:hypothetical protein